MITIELIHKLVQRAINTAPGAAHKALRDNPESYYAPYYKFLYLLVQQLRPQLALECGVYRGTATEHMALANPDTTVIGIDLEWRLEAIEMRNRNPNVYLINGDTAASCHLVELYMKEHYIDGIGLLFLDSAHDTITPMNEFEAYRPMFAKETVVVCDDVLFPEMSEFWEWLPGVKLLFPHLHPPLNATYRPSGIGVSLFWRKS